jgi:hypothetical protein
MERIKRDKPEGEKQERKATDILVIIERDIYSEAGVFDCVDNDQISNIEQGFMHGYISAA